jgi:hypothetical protein
MAVRIAIDLNLFELLVQRPHTLDELAEKTKADAKLIKRMLRVVTSIGYLQQTKTDVWEASPLTHVAVVPAFRDWLLAHYIKRFEMYAEFPDWLKRHDYKTSWVDENDNIAKQVFGTDVWTWYGQNPEQAKIFESAMSIQEGFPKEITPPYPFASGFDGIKTGPKDVTLVDVGGGRGQAIKALRDTYPGIPGRLILQDLPMTIEKLDAAEIKSSGFEATSHNFFEPQPIKGARYYHLRRILHDWSDEKCLEILAALRPALDPSYSRLLIGEFILPDVSPGPTETAVDLLMMTTCGGAERAELEWHELLGQAGFKIEKIWRADVGTTGIIEASVAQA